MALQIDVIWLVSVGICAWLGYHLAERTALNPKAGLMLGVAVNFFMAMDMTLPALHLGKTVLEIELLSVYFSVLACLWLLLLVGNRKGIALFKVGAAVTVLAFAFSLLPRDLLPGRLAEPISFEAEPVAHALPFHY